MKRAIVAAIITISALVLVAYFTYRVMLPAMIAEAVVSESLPAYIPKRMQARVEAIRAPFNEGAEAMVKRMHQSNIPVDHVLRTVDNISEDQAYDFLDELNKTKPSNTNEVFDIVKKHFSSDFDIEIFRDPFNRYFDMKQIEKAISYANFNRKTNDVNITTVKAILKKIILEKEKEINERKNQ